MALNPSAFANYGPDADEVIKVGKVLGPSQDGVYHVVVDVRADSEKTVVGFYALDTYEALTEAANEFGWEGSEEAA